MKFSIFIIFILLAILPLAAEKVPAKVEFNKHIRPLFSSTCFNCHGPDEHEVKGKLQLHTFEAATKKLGKKKNRQAIAPGKPELSEVWKRISTNDEDDIMPPLDFHHKLTDFDKQLIKKWILQGAEYQDHWAYEPVVRQRGQTIDSLVSKQLKLIGISTQNQMDSKRVLIRRLSFDLRGLPPSQIEINSFLKDSSAKAWEKLVDKFLSDKAYGERMGVHWMDVIRFSSSVGFHGDQELHTSPYRDYIINAFNTNKPYDQFTREQLAGDLLPKPTQEQLIATAYNRLNKVTKEGGAQAGEYLAKYAADRVSNVSATWLGSTLECAECHNHKYDPFTQKDFYTMAAFFADVEQKGVYSGGNNGTFAPQITILPAKEKATLAKLEAAFKKMKKKSKEYNEAAKQIKSLKAKSKLAVITKQMKPLVTKILPRGNWMDNSGEVVQPAVPHLFKQIKKSGRANRLDLANWLCSEDNPLAARAFSNRVWNLFFGNGISKVAEDLGSMGEMPVNPELLDYLSAGFIDSKWNVKALVKAIVMSKTYRLKTDRTPEMEQKDPYNRYLARQSILRLNAEFIRDNALKVSGLLNTNMGGRNIMPYQPAGYYSSMNFNPFRYKPEADSNQYRRGVYMHWQRTFLHPFLKNFDAPEREVSICARTSSNTPLQALTLLNDPTFLEAAKALAERAVVEGGKTFNSQIEWAFLEALGRPASNGEKGILNKVFLSQHSFYKNNYKEAEELLSIGNKKVNPKLNKPLVAAWMQVSRAIMNMHEFIVRR